MQVLPRRNPIRRKLERLHLGVVSKGAAMDEQRRAGGQRWSSGVISSQARGPPPDQRCLNESDCAFDMADIFIVVSHSHFRMGIRFGLIHSVRSAGMLAQGGR